MYVRFPRNLTRASIEILATTELSMGSHWQELPSRDPLLQNPKHGFQDRRQTLRRDVDG